jgi:hypothetical protein
MAPRTFSPTFAHRALSRRQLLHGFAAVAASSVLTGCGAALVRSISSSNGAPPATPPAPPPVTPPAPPPATPPSTPPPTPPTPPTQPPAPVSQPVPIGAITSASLTVASTTAGSFDPGFLGLAYEKQSLLTPLFNATNTDLLGLFQRLGPGVLRIGGASVDQSVWTADGPGHTPGQVAPSDVDALASFLRATGWSCIYGLNLGGSATGATTPALAAAEVAYVAQQLGSALLGVELGNECETYGASFYPNNWSVEIFEALWQQYRSAIVAVTPGAPLCGPAAGSSLDTWTLPFSEYVTSDQINLLTQQTTRGPVSTASVDDLITPDAALSTELLMLHYGAQSIGVPFRIDALSSYDDGGAPGVSNTYAAALWTVDTIFQTALAGASGINLQGGGQQSGTAIADNNGIVLGPQPVFYGALLAAMAGTGTLLSTQLSAGALNVTAYALQTASGMSLLLVNKDATENLDLSTILPQAMSSATLQQMTQLSAGATAPSLAALSGISIQGATVATDGAFQPAASYSLTLNGTQLSCYVPTLSAVLIQLT